MVDPRSETMLTVGTTTAPMVTVAVVFAQPVAVEVNVNVTVPAVRPVMSPALSIDATAGELLTHVPPAPGVAFIVAPTHNDV